VRAIDCGCTPPCGGVQPPESHTLATMLPVPSRPKHNLHAGLPVLSALFLLACERGPYQMERSFPVMGTTLRMQVAAVDSATAAAALQAAHDEVVLVDNLMSSYQDNSEISVVNRRAGTDSITYVSPSTTSVLAAALKYAQDTEGAFDVSVGPLVHVWGLHDHSGRVPTSAQIDSARRLTGLTRIQFKQSERTVRLPQRGMQLDFGAIAQGFALDRAARALRAGGAESARVTLGGNVLVFRSSVGAAWQVGVRDPRDTTLVLATLVLDSGAVSTSPSYTRSFESGGVRYSDVIDPRTGRAVQGVTSVTVVGNTGMASDAMATALFVLGAERGCTVAARAGVAAVWLTATEAHGQAQITATPGMDKLIQRSDSLPLLRCR
jgi:FAD:protein FMN transferase